MSIIATDYADPTDPTTPIPSACAWIFDIRPSFGTGGYFLTVWVHRSVGAADLTPLVDPAEKFTVSQGDKLADDSVMPTIAEIDAEAAAIQSENPGLSPFNAIRTVLYQYLSKHPKFAGTNPTQG